MRAMYARPIGFIVVVTLLLAVGGCASRNAAPEEQQNDAFADVKAEIRDAVDDQTREDQAVALVSELEANFDNSRVEIQARKDRVRALNADYDASRADLEYEFAALEQEIINVNEDLLRLSSELQSVLTEDEQKQINRSSMAYLESAIGSLRAI